MSANLTVATRKGLFFLEPVASGWSVAHAGFVGDPVTAVLRTAGGRLLAALNLGHFGVKLHRSSDDGRTWEEVATPSFPSKPESAEDDPHPWNVSQIWSLEDGGHNRTVWAGTLPGALFRSRDEGESWELVESLWNLPERREWFGGGYDVPGIHSVSVDPRNADRLLAAISCGGVWLSEDAGASWRSRTAGMWAAYVPPERKDDPAIQDPHRLVRCPSAPETLWASHHNGVFTSVDEGVSWTEVESIEPSNFGFAAAVSPTDSRTAWLVPAIKDECRVPVDARVVVARTRDGGESFEVLREGLPQEHAYDLVFRHALDVAADGERLALGSTTGNLWTSANQGDSWELMSAHLPPIYAVRFSP